MPNQGLSRGTLIAPHETLVCIKKVIRQQLPAVQCTTMGTLRPMSHSHQWGWHGSFSPPWIGGAISVHMAIMRASTCLSVPHAATDYSLSTMIVIMCIIADCLCLQPWQLVDSQTVVHMHISSSGTATYCQQYISSSRILCSIDCNTHAASTSEISAIMHLLWFGVVWPDFSDGSSVAALLLATACFCPISYCTSLAVAAYAIPCRQQCLCAWSLPDLAISDTLLGGG